MDEVTAGLRRAEGVEIALRGEGQEMKTPKPHQPQIRRGGASDLNGDVGLEPQHVGRTHRAIEVDDQLGIGTLELDEPGGYPSRPQALGDRKTNLSGDVVAIGFGAGLNQTE